MIYLSATEAKQNFTEFLDKAQKEPITIQRQEQDLVVVLSVLEYQRLTKLLKNEFQGFCDQVGKNAEVKGMTEEKLKEILERQRRASNDLQSVSKIELHSRLMTERP